MLLVFIIIMFILLFLFLNLGSFLDITEKPKKADIIVSLGGASGCRLTTALSLYKEDFSISNKFIYTGRDSIGLKYSKIKSRRNFLLNNGISLKNIVHVDRNMITNTMEEVFFIKQYMLMHNYTSVLFISHPHHSRRIATLAGVIANYDKYGLNYEVISCNPTWWDKRKFYLNETSIKISISETVKLVYNLLKYSPLLISYTKYASKVKNKEWEKAIKRLN